ncbi:hypothetical protein HRK28_17325 [Rathayibacter sp. VKM Ac-2835]|uniref:hypothetical protein n=1 Tax=Rathayibacter sp. VKM Ac-2835 TaxID=2739043 RepID=UPI001563654C|nr:hypothetical protein [Rathayibacter sp. VKM Ac-2835]NRG42677.1 hypothetical protein [Rathayibacter sp. VKM Ac-2835]
MTEQELKSVADVARERGVSAARIRQLIAEGRIRAEKVGGVHVIRGNQDVPSPRVSRPLGDRMAWGLVAALSGAVDPALTRSERSRITRMIQRLESAEDPVAVTRSWTAELLPPESLELPTELVDQLRGERELLPVGASDPRAGPRDVSRLELLVSVRLKAQLREEVAAAGPSSTSVILHHVPDERWPFVSEGPVPIGLSIAALARRTDRTTALAARRLLRRALPSHAAVLAEVEADRRDRDRSLRRETTRSVQLHRAALELLDRSPDFRPRAEARLEQLRGKVRGDAHEWLDEWAELLRSPLSTQIEALLVETEHAHDLRSVSPLAGLIPDEERSALLEASA